MAKALSLYKVLSESEIIQEADKQKFVSLRSELSEKLKQQMLMAINDKDEDEIERYAQLFKTIEEQGEGMKHQINILFKKFKNHFQQKNCKTSNILIDYSHYLMNDKIQKDIDIIIQDMFQNTVVTIPTHDQDQQQQLVSDSYGEIQRILVDCMENYASSIIQLFDHESLIEFIKNIDKIAKEKATQVIQHFINQSKLEKFLILSDNFMSEQGGSQQYILCQTTIKIERILPWKFLQIKYQGLSEDQEIQLDQICEEIIRFSQYYQSYVIYIMQLIMKSTSGSPMKAKSQPLNQSKAIGSNNLVKQIQRQIQFHLMDELVNNYIILEKFYLKNSLNKALDTDNQEYVKIVQKSFNSDKFESSQDIMEFVDDAEKVPEFENIPFNETLGIQCIPYFGIYGFEYQWLYPTGVFRREFSTGKDLNEIKHSFPQKINQIVSEGIEKNILLKPQQLHYYILNLNAKSFKNSFLLERNQSRVRINFAPHAYIWPNAKYGQDSKINILSAIYTSYNNEMIHSSFRGIDECEDFGRISINPGNFYSKINFQEVHLHPADNDNMAISPNNGTFLLNLGFPIINFHVVMQTTSGEQQLSIFNVTIVNDETMEMTRQVDTCLNLQKIFTHTPIRSDIEKNEKKLMIPGLYVKVFEKSVIPLTNAIEGNFSVFLEKFENSTDQEQLLKELFIKLFVEAPIQDAEVYPHINLVAQDFLDLFYKYIWFKLKSPDIKNFGKRFFMEIADTPYKLHLLVKFMKIQSSWGEEAVFQHSNVLQKFIPSNLDIEMKDESIQNSPAKKQSPAKVEIEEEKKQIQEGGDKISPIKKPKLLINSSENFQEDDLNTDFIKSLPKDVTFPQNEALTDHLNCLFDSSNKQQIKQSFLALKPLLQEYIFYEVWRQKGSIHGIHLDFGKHSYLQTDEIGEYYHLNDEDRINFILALQDQFANL